MAWRPVILIFILSAGILTLGYRLFLLPEICAVRTMAAGQLSQAGEKQTVSFDARQLEFLLQAALPEDFALKDPAVIFDGDTAILSGRMARRDLLDCLSPETPAQSALLQSVLIFTPDPVRLGLTLKPVNSEQGGLMLRPVSFSVENFIFAVDLLPPGLVRKLESALAETVRILDADIDNAYVSDDKLVLVLR